MTSKLRLQRLDLKPTGVGAAAYTYSSITVAADGRVTAAASGAAPLTDGTVYALLAGRAGGQTLKGGTAASEALTLQSTANATKGKLLFGTSAYDEVNNRLGIGTTTPSYSLDVEKDQAGGTVIQVGNASAATNASAGTVVTNGTHSLSIGHYGTAYTTSGIFRQDGGIVYSNGAGGLTLSTANGAYPIYFAIDSIEKMRLDGAGNLVIGATTAGARLDVVGSFRASTAITLSGLAVYADNAAAVAGGLGAGRLYRTGADPDPVCVVH